MEKRMKIKRIVFLVLAIFMVVNLMSFVVLAVDSPAKIAQDINKDSASVQINSTKWLGIAGMILYFIRLIGTVLGIILVVFFGIQWMISNQNKRAELKDKMWNYVIGAGFLFGAGPIAKLFYDVITNNITQ